MIKESSFLSTGSTFFVFPKFFDFLIFWGPITKFLIYWFLIQKIYMLNHFNLPI